MLVSVFVFRAESLSRINIPALIYLPLPLLLWASMRFGPAGLSASLLTIALVSVESLMHGRGPFISTSPAESVLSMQVFLCMIGVPLLLLAAVTIERRRTEVSLRETSRKLIDAQERERQRIARELHDDIGQTLTLAEIEIDRMMTHPRDPEPGVRLHKLRDQMTMVSQGIWELSHGLYPSNLEILGLVTALHRLCADLREQTRLDVLCEKREIPDPLPPDVSLCLYRVAQEALQNIVRHSHATSASGTVARAVGAPAAPGGRRRRRVRSGPRRLWSWLRQHARAAECRERRPRYLLPARPRHEARRLGRTAPAADPRSRTDDSLIRR